MYFLGAILFPGRANQQLLVKFPSLHDTLGCFTWMAWSYIPSTTTNLPFSQHNRLYIYYRPATELRECNVFSRVCPSFFPRGETFHVTITHDAFDFTVQGPQLWPHSSHLEMRHGTPQHIRPETPLAPAPALPTALLVTSGGDHWRPVQTRSFGILPLGMTSGGVH